MQLCCVTLDLVVRLAGCGNPGWQFCLPAREKKGVQVSPDSPLCGLPIGTLFVLFYFNFLHLFFYLPENHKNHELL